jgi:polysaccharide export outer membrane protein
MSDVGYQGVTMIGGKTGIVSALLALVVSVGCAGGGTPHPPEPPPMEKAEYVIGAGDHLTIRVWKNPELSVQVPVRPDGKVSVPLLDDVQAEGLTTGELKEVITRDLSEYITNPDVTVIVELIGSKHVYVIGEVERSGPIPLGKDQRVLDAISAAGGFGAFADKKRVKIIRRQEDGEVEYRFNYDAYVGGNAPGTNLLLVPGDTIVVPD